MSRISSQGRGMKAASEAVVLQNDISLCRCGIEFADIVLMTRPVDYGLNVIYHKALLFFAEKDSK
jgi:hypothetical protein